MIYLYAVLYLVVGLVFIAYLSTKDEAFHILAPILIAIWPIVLLAIIIVYLTYTPYEMLRNYFLRKKGE